MADRFIKNRKPFVKERRNIELLKLRLKITPFLTRITINKFLDSLSFNFNLEERIFVFKLLNFILSFFLMLVFSHFIVAVVLIGLNSFFNALTMELISNFLKINSNKKVIYFKRKRRKDALYIIISTCISMLFIILALKKNKEIFNLIVN